MIVTNLHAFEETTTNRAAARQLPEPCHPAGPTSGAHAAERVLGKSVNVPASLDQVWDAWTTGEGVTSLFAPDAPPASTAAPS